MKERFEWVNSWCDETTSSDLPRVLLVGDSITCGYQEKVRSKLKGVCYVDYISTSYAIDTKIYNDRVSSFFADSDYALIHFNHGLHGAHIYKRTYKSRLKKLLQRAKNGKIVLATTTYNGGIFPKMKEFIEHLTEKNYQNKKIALIENGSWAPAAVKVMCSLLEKCKNLTYCNEKIKILSALTEENKNSIKILAKELSE